jgi:hypothetical protein
MPGKFGSWNGRNDDSGIVLPAPLISENGGNEAALQEATKAWVVGKERVNVGFRNLNSEAAGGIGRAKRFRAIEPLSTNRDVWDWPLRHPIDNGSRDDNGSGNGEPIEEQAESSASGQQQEHLGHSTHRWKDSTAGKKVPPHAVKL